MKPVLLMILTLGINLFAEKKPPITPMWALGHIVWEDSINTQHSAQILVDQYLKNQIPVGGIIIDSPWSLSYNDFNWNPSRYPDPNEMLRYFNKNHVKVILWLTGCVNIESKDVPVQKNPYYDYVIKKKYVINNGTPSEWWKGKGVHIDFTNPEAVAWWETRLDKVFLTGVYGWKVDNGENYFGDSLQTSIGKISNVEFKHFYYDHMFDYTVKRKKDGIIIARPFSYQGGFAASISKLSLGWTGDFTGNWEGLKKQIKNIYISAEAGYGALACEIGGFFDKRSTKTQLIRYVQFGSMTACMINGGENGAFTNHLPWFHDDETAEIYRYYTTLHYQLRPYIFSSIVDAHFKGGSLIKVVSPEQESHMLGDEIFFKAITSETGKVSFSLPDNDEWIDYWTGKRFKGGSIISENYSLAKAPIFIRSGAIIPLDVRNDITEWGDETFVDKTVILIYPDGKNRYQYHKPQGDGIDYENIEISYQDGEIKVHSESVNSFVLVVMSDSIPDEVKGSDALHYNKMKKWIEIEKKGKDFCLLIR